MNRRHFITGSAAMATLLANHSAAALDIDVEASPLMQLFDTVPDRPGADGVDFPPTYATNHGIKNGVDSENPDMYWDPFGNDLDTLFGFHSDMIILEIGQREPGRLTVWSIDTSTKRDEVIASLADQGWSIIDEDLQLLQYSGSDDDRAGLVESLNILGFTIRDGEWDFIALPKDYTMVLGADGELVRTTAERVKSYVAMATVDTRFHALRYVLPVSAYDVVLLPPQELPIAKATASFVSKSWNGNEPIIHSVGVRCDDQNIAAQMMEDVPRRLDSEMSPITDRPYGEFLEFADIKSQYSSVRFDFFVTDGEWDVLEASESEDLLMFPFSN